MTLIAIICYTKTNQNKLLVGNCDICSHPLGVTIIIRTIRITEIVFWLRMQQESVNNKKESLK